MRAVKRPFEAVAIRYVHDPRTEEFLNVGVVVFCAAAPFAGARFLSQWGRVTAAFPGADLVVLRRVARALERRCDEWGAEAAKQLTLDPTRDVLALVRSAIHLDDAMIQLSPVISGLTAGAERTLGELFALYVSGSAEPAARGREDGDVWRAFAQRFADAGSLRRMQRKVLETRHYECAFEHAWQNGHWNVAQPLSLDLVEPRTIREKATTWSGRILTLHPQKLEVDVFLLVGMPGDDCPPAIREAANDALAILEENLHVEAKVLTEDHGDKLARKIEEDLRAHDIADSSSR